MYALKRRFVEALINAVARRFHATRVDVEELEVRPLTFLWNRSWGEGWLETMAFVLGVRENVLVKHLFMSPEEMAKWRDVYWQSLLTRLRLRRAQLESELDAIPRLHVPKPSDRRRGVRTRTGTPSANTINECTINAVGQGFGAPG